MLSRDRRRVMLTVDCEAEFEYWHGRPGHGMQPSAEGDAQPGTAHQVERVLRLKHASTGTDLSFLLDKNTHTDICETLQELIDDGDIPFAGQTETHDGTG